MSYFYAVTFTSEGIEWKLKHPTTKRLVESLSIIAALEQSTLLWAWSSCRKFIVNWGPSTKYLAVGMVNRVGSLSITAALHQSTLLREWSIV